MQSIILFSLVGLGYALKKLGIFKSEDSGFLVKLVLRVTMPVLVATSFLSTRIEAKHGGIMLTAAVTTILLLTSWYFIFRLTIKDKALRGTALLLAFFSNMGFMGIPFIQNLFGTEGVSFAVLFGQLSSSDFLFFTVGIMICAAHSPVKHGKTNGQILKDVLTTPVVLAIPAGVILHFVGLPEVILRAVSLVGDANTFLIMFAVGLMLQPEKFSLTLALPTLGLSIITLLIYPLTTLAVGRLFHLSQLPLQIAVLQSAMPSAVLNVVMAKEYKLNVELSESVLVASTILSAVTLPLWQYWLSRLA